MSIYNPGDISKGAAGTITWANGIKDNSINISDNIHSQYQSLYSDCSEYRASAYYTGVSDNVEYFVEWLPLSMRVQDSAYEQRLKILDGTTSGSFSVELLTNSISFVKKSIYDICDLRISAKRVDADGGLTTRKVRYNLYSTDSAGAITKEADGAWYTPGTSYTEYSYTSIDISSITDGKLCFFTVDANMGDTNVDNVGQSSVYIRDLKVEMKTS